VSGLRAGAKASTRAGGAKAGAGVRAGVRARITARNPRREPSVDSTLPPRAPGVEGYAREVPHESWETTGHRKLLRGRYDTAFVGYETRQGSRRLKGPWEVQEA